MKKLITLLAVTATFAVLAPVTMQARDSHGHSSRSYSHSCGSCRAPVYRERVFAGYNRCGEPVYSWRTVGHSCRSGHGHGHSSGHGSRGGHVSFPGLHLDLGGRGSH